MAAWRTVLALAAGLAGIEALTTPPQRSHRAVARTLVRRSAAASAAGDAPQSLRAAVEEAKSVKRKDREAQAIDRAVARVTRDMDRVDFSSDRRGALERREKVALGAATAVAAGATLTAAAPAATALSLIHISEPTRPY